MLRADREALRTAEASESATQTLARTLSAEGYAASLRPAGAGEQLCQHHCPVAHVAERFPQLCDAETEAFSRQLGVHVQRLATIAHGDGVCTTHIPRSTQTAATPPAPPDPPPDVPTSQAPTGTSGPATGLNLQTHSLMHGPDHEEHAT